MKRISKRLASSGALDVVATAVPGMKDILVLGKVKSLEESRTADLIIVDAPAAGHAVTFLLSARGLLDAVRVGPIRKQAQDVVSLLSDPDALPGDARDAPRGDAGERGHRHRVRDRGPRRRRARPGDRERLLHARCPVAVSHATRPRSSPTRAPPTASSRRAKPTTSRTRPRSSPSATRCSRRTDRAAPRTAAAPADRAAVLFTPTSRAAARHARRRAPARDRATVTAGDDRASNELVDDRRRSSSAAAAAASARRRPPPCIALEGARRGRNACVVTIDPAQRLADALGLEHLGNDPTEIDRDLWADGAGERPAGGRLSALMLDTKSTFDRLVTRNASSPEQAQRILDNTLLPQRLRRARRHAGVHGDGEAARAARRRRLRPHRRRHAADASRARLPRRAAAPHAAARQPHLPPA